MCLYVLIYGFEYLFVHLFVHVYVFTCLGAADVNELSAESGATHHFSFSMVIFCLFLVPSFSYPQPLSSVAEDHPVLNSICHIFSNCAVSQKV
jgi:hypothetical protein